MRFALPFATSPPTNPGTAPTPVVVRPTAAPAVANAKLSIADGAACPSLNADISAKFEKPGSSIKSSNDAKCWPIRPAWPSNLSASTRFCFAASGSSVK